MSPIVDVNRLDAIRGHLALAEVSRPMPGYPIDDTHVKIIILVQ